MQNSSTRFIKCCDCYADFKYYEVADFKNYECAELRLRTKFLNVQLRTCVCGLRKLKFSCGFADLKKKLAVPSTGINVRARARVTVWFKIRVGLRLG